MKEETRIVYITEDGKEFINKQDAIDHEDKLKNVKAFVVHYCPDLTEGRGLQKAGIVWVHAHHSHRDFVENWCYTNFGNRISFVMGAFGSNAITHCWSIREAKEQDLKNFKVLERIEENFIQKIWS